MKKLTVEERIKNTSARVELAKELKNYWKSNYYTVSIDENGNEEERLWSYHDGDDTLLIREALLNDLIETLLG